MTHSSIYIHIFISRFTHWNCLHRPSVHFYALVLVLAHRGSSSKRRLCKERPEKGCARRYVRVCVGMSKGVILGLKAHRIFKDWYTKWMCLQKQVNKQTNLQIYTYTICVLLSAYIEIVHTPFFFLFTFSFLFIYLLEHAITPIRRASIPTITTVPTI